MLPIAFIPGPRRRSRKRRGAFVELALAAATYQAGASVTLIFNQAVEIGGIALNSFDLDDGPGGHVYVGVSAVLVDPVTVKIMLVSITNDSGPNVTLLADEANGITSAATGQMWEGAQGLVLPFP